MELLLPLEMDCFPAAARSERVYHLLFRSHFFLFVKINHLLCLRFYFRTFSLFREPKGIKILCVIIAPTAI